jgi:hypothetical protein
MALTFPFSIPTSRLRPIDKTASSNNWSKRNGELDSSDEEMEARDSGTEDSYAPGNLLLVWFLFPTSKSSDRKDTYSKLVLKIILKDSKKGWTSQYSLRVITFGHKSAIDSRAPG